MGFMVTVDGGCLGRWMLSTATLIFRCKVGGWRKSSSDLVVVARVATQWSALQSRLIVLPGV